MSCAFFSCANASDSGNSPATGGNDNPSGNGTPTTGENDLQSLSSARWSCATSEEETAIGNKVSEVLCLFDDNKFELRKNISYSGENENISFFQTFYKGTYAGGIRNGMTFDIQEELDTKDFDDEMNQVFNLNGADAQSERLATSRSAMTTSRAAARSIAAILAECQEKLKSAKFKAAENKAISLETEKDSVVLTSTVSGKKEVKENAMDGCINLEGFLLTGNPCNMIPENETDFRWANNADEGARILEKTADGKWTCKFRADGNDTLIRIIWKDWAADWGLSSIDKENSKLPSGVGITDDTQAVNQEHPEWQDPRNIAITGLEAKRKYEITFDTKKSPGKICIELAEHKISTLDGWLLSGSSTEWAGTVADGALQLEKIGDTWQVSFTANKGWCGFNLCTPEWKDSIGWSSFDWEYPCGMYNLLRGSNAEKYSLADDDAITFRSWDNLNFEGNEKITLKFGINNGRVTCKTSIEYAEEFDLDLYTEYFIDNSEPNSSGGYTSLARGKIESDKSFSFSISESSALLTIAYILEEENSITYPLIDRQKLESVELPSGVKYTIHNFGTILLTGLVPDKTYNVQLTKGNETCCFKIIITE